MAKLVAIIFLFLSTSLDAQTVIMGKVIANSGDPSAVYTSIASRMKKEPRPTP